MAKLVWHDARIRDSDIWRSSWPAGTKVLVAKSGHKLAVGTIWWVFDGKHLRSVAEPLHRQAFVVKGQHSDQRACNAHARPFLVRHMEFRRPPED